MDGLHPREVKGNNIFNHPITMYIFSFVSEWIYFNRNRISQSLLLGD